MKSTLRILIALLCLSAAAVATTELWETEEGRERVFNALVTIFKENYWDPAHVDWDAWAGRHREAVVSAGSRFDFDAGFRRMIGELADDHSSWSGLPEVPLPRARPGTPPSPRLGLLAEFLPGEGLVVMRVLPSGPADLAGLRRGDVVVSAAGRPLQGNDQFRSLLGDLEFGQSLELEVRRRRDLMTFLVRPDAVTSDGMLRPQAEMLTENTGYLFLPSFRGDGVAAETHRLIDELQAEGARSLVLDLRGNLGGRLAEMGLVLGAFIEGPWGRAVSQGEVVWQGRYQHGDDLGVSYLEAPDGTAVRRDELLAPVRFDGPLVVLVDDRNSSAGEVAALALQDLDRATVIGVATEGNVEAVQGFDLPDGSQVFVAVANLEGVAGTPFSIGIAPDVVSREALSELARGFDAPVAEALRVLGGLPFTPNKFF